jgi:hypothetical protein
MLYGNMSKVGDTVATPQIQLAGNCFRHKKLPAIDFIIWAPKHEARKGGKIDLCGHFEKKVKSENEIAKCLMDYDVWRIHFRTQLRLPIVVVVTCH